MHTIIHSNPHLRLKLLFILAGATQVFACEGDRESETSSRLVLLRQSSVSGQQPSAVRIGEATHPLAGFDPGTADGWGGDPSYPGHRGEDQLIVFSAAYGAATQTNQWGLECAVSSDRTIRTLNDRWRSRSQMGTTIPADGYVMSGHGEARDWLLQHAASGSRAELVYEGSGSDGGEAGSAGGPPPPESGRDGRVRLMWHNGWSGPAITEYPPDVLAGLSHISLSMSQSAERGTGKLTLPEGIDASQIAYAHDNGITVLVGMGGSSDGGITITSTDTAQQALDSLLSFRSAIGIDGVDIDLEPSGSNWSSAGIDALISGCVANGLHVAVTSALYSQWTQAWGAVAQRWSGQIDFWASMNYDFPEAGDSRLNDVVIGKIDAQKQYGIAERKIVAGFMPRPSDSYRNASPPGVIAPAYLAGRDVAPDVGWMIWEDKISGATDWQDVRALIAAD